MINRQKNQYGGTKQLGRKEYSINPAADWKDISTIDFNTLNRYAVESDPTFEELYSIFIYQYFLISQGILAGKLNSITQHTI